MSGRRLSLHLSREELEAAQAEGLGLGDLVEAATSLLGIKPCEGCKRRKRALNRIRLPFTRRGKKRAVDARSEVR